MQPRNPTDHIAILSLMMVGVLTQRLCDIEQLDDGTRKHMKRLVGNVRKHAKTHGIDDLDALFNKIEGALA